MSNLKRFSSRKEVTEFLATKGINTSNWSEEKWFSLNKGQAEIHIMDLAEKIYDAMNESTPNQLKAGEWHIPFEDKINIEDLIIKNNYDNIDLWEEALNKDKVKISTAMAARTSYTVVGEEKGMDYKKMIDLHDRLIAQNPPHSSPMEHCAKAMSDEEYESFIKGELNYLETEEEEYLQIDEPKFKEKGWCRNFKGFLSYRSILENGR